MTAISSPKAVARVFLRAALLTTLSFGCGGDQTGVSSVPSGAGNGDARDDREDAAVDAGDARDAAKPDDGCRAATSETFALLSQRCSGCHANGNAQGGFGAVLDPAAMIASKRVVVNDAPGSKLYARVKSGAMPLGGPVLATAQIETIGRWINCGAPAFAGDAGVGADAGPGRDAGVDDAGRDDDDDDQDADEDLDEDVDEAAEEAAKDADDAAEEAAEKDD
jgi:mono/diheme cytochrome c family protein